MIDAPDPRLIKLAQQLERERAARIAAEKQATGLRSVLTRMKRERQRTNDAVPKLEHEQRPGC